MCLMYVVEKVVGSGLKRSDGRDADIASYQCDMLVLACLFIQKVGDL